jgi:DNA mismatch repair protein MutL
VNGRAVRDTGIVRAAESAYRSTIPAGVRPTLFLDVVVAADMVDVNVHPAKAEVRFRDRWQVERAVEGAVRRALGTFDAGPTFGRMVWTTVPLPAPEPVSVDVESLRASATAEGLFEPDQAEVATEEGRGNSVPEAPSAPVVSDVPPLMQLQRSYLMFEHDHESFSSIAHERVVRAVHAHARGRRPAVADCRSR